MDILKTKNIEKFHTFHERFLIHFGLMKDSFHPESKIRSTALNNPADPTGYHQRMIDASAKEMQKPVNDTIEGTRKELLELAKLPKSIFKKTANLVGKIVTTPIAVVGETATKLTMGTAKIVTQLVTNPLALAMNVPRYAFDIARLAPRAAVAIFDYTGKFIGKPSAILQSTRDRALGAIDKANEKVLTMGANIRGKVLSAIGADAEGH